MRAAQSFFATAPGGARLLTVEIAPNGGVVTVRALGEVDSFTGPTLEDALAAAAATEPVRVVLDLTSVTYFSASSVAILHRARRQVSDGPGELEVVTRPGIVERVVSLFVRSAAAA